MTTITAAHAAAFRLSRQHLDAGRRARATLVDVCRQTGGIQAQVMSAAELSLWTRRRATTRDDIRNALWQRRDLVKTSAMRMTLHVIPASDLALYVAALKQNQSAILARIFERLRVKPAEVDAVMTLMVDALADGPKTQQELVAVASAGARPGILKWLNKAWSAVRPAVVEGQIVYGPPKGAEATFVRVDRWLAAQPDIDRETARAELMRRFLAAFGPATPNDFARWTGIRIGEAKQAVEALAGEVEKVSVDGAPGWALARDLDEIAGSRLDARAVRLLPAFDTFLLAHATKEHLVEPRFRPRVYRPQGWLSPVVLVGGRIAAVWFSKARGGGVDIDVQPFRRLDRATRDAVAAEAGEIGEFLQVRCAVRFTRYN